MQGHGVLAPTGSRTHTVPTQLKEQHWFVCRWGGGHEREGVVVVDEDVWVQGGEVSNYIGKLIIC